LAWQLENISFSVVQEYDALSLSFSGKKLHLDFQNLVFD